MTVSSKTVNEIVMLINDGWRPYNNQPEGYVYEGLECSQYKKNRPSWFVKGDKYLCISCSSRCALFRPAGFQPPLPLNYPQSEEQQSFTLTPLEMVERKATLNMQEVCYCLNVSYSKAYLWVREGRLIKLVDKPIRKVFHNKRKYSWA